jgi:hypothetical protein
MMEFLDLSLTLKEDFGLAELPILGRDVELGLDAKML